MRKYERVVGTFLRKVAKLDRIAAKNAIKIDRLLAKSDRIKARIKAKIFKLEEKDMALAAEAAACTKTATKISNMLA